MTNYKKDNCEQCRVKALNYNTAARLREDARERKKTALSRKEQSKELHDELDRIKREHGVTAI